MEGVFADTAVPEQPAAVPQEVVAAASQPPALSEATQAGEKSGYYAALAGRHQASSEAAIKAPAPQIDPLQLPRLSLPNATAGTAMPAAQRDLQLAANVKELYEAMKGGLTGAGIDLRRVLGALQGLNAQDIERVKAIYSDHYGRELERDLQQELRADRRALDRIQPLLSGNRAESEAIALRRQLVAELPDPGEIVRLLESGDSEAHAALMECYRQRYGCGLRDDLERALPAREATVAVALLEDRPAAAEAVELQGAIERKDIELVRVILEQPRAEVAEVLGEFAASNGVSLQNAIEAVSEGNLQRHLCALAVGDRREADLYSVRAARAQGSELLEHLAAVLGELSSEERAAFADRYQELFGEALEFDLRARLRPEAAELACALLKNGELLDVEQLRALLLQDKAPALEDIVELLAGMDAGEIERLMTDYQQRYVADAAEALSSSLSGAERFEANLALLGEPGDRTEQLWRAEARYTYERQGVKRVEAMIIDACAPHGKLLENTRRRLHEHYHQIARPGYRLQPGDEQRFQQLASYFEDDLDTYRSAKCAYVRTVSDLFSIFALTATALICWQSGQHWLVGSLLSVMAAGAAKSISAQCFAGRYSSGERVIEELKTRRYGKRKGRGKKAHRAGSSAGAKRAVRKKRAALTRRVTRI